MIKGIGTDIVEHSRINLKISRKILTKKEMLIFEQHHNKIEFLASRFCLKEAIIKATNKKYKFSEIEIFNDENGAIKTNLENIMISIAHEHNYSIAFCIWEE